MLKFIKKQKVGNWITLGALILAIVSSIIYGVHIGIKGGTFYGAAVDSLVACSVVSILLLAGVLVVSQFEFEGIIGRVVDILCDAVRIIVPALLVLGLINLIYSRVEGLAFIYFSAENIIASIQTPENLASAESGIASFVFYGITAVVAIIAAFFGIGKRGEKPADEAVAA